METQAPLTGLQLVPFRDVLSNVVQDAHASLTQLAGRLPGLSDEERKHQLLEYLQTTRQRLQRLHVCAQWAHKAKAVNTCREVLKAAQDHGAAFVHTADELFRLHEELRFSRAPLFDVSTSLHISQTGSYRLLPRIIEDELQQPGQRLERPGELDDAARARQRRDAQRRVDFLLRSKLLATELPTGMRVLRVRGGQATVAAAGGQYTARLTLVPAPRDDVTLAKYRPPGEPEGTAAAKEEPEVAQPAVDAGPSTSAAAAAHHPGTSAAAAAPGLLAGHLREGPDCWRWQLLSFELLPAAAGHDPAPLLPAQRTWLQQHVEQRMWVAADVEQLVRLGKATWVTVPELPSAKEQQQRGRASAGVPSASAAPTPSASMAAADDKGKQPVKEEPLEGLQGADQQPPEDARQNLPAFAASPLAAMHGILCQTAGRLALFSLLLSDAQQLEGGSWKGGLKLSRAADGKGLRLSYWQGVPCASHAELQCMQEGWPYQPEAQAAGAPAGGPTAAQQQQSQQQQVSPALEVAVQEDGSLAAESLPPLRHALSSEAVQLRLPLDSASSLCADRLLLEAAAHSAALQLAAVQAALQCSGRLGAVHAELSIPPSSSNSSGGEAALPPSPQLHVWNGGSVQLSLSVQLRTGRLLLRAGPTLLEGDQGSEAAALVAAVQQQLDQLQRDAMSLPLPPGSSRGMLAARLAADALGRLSVQLSMRQRMQAATAAAAACGLRPAALPQQLLTAYLRQAAALLEPPSANTLNLVLPAFPPPPDMQRWARQQQQRRQGSAVGSGAIRCFLVLDFGEPAAAAGAVGEAAPEKPVRQLGSPSAQQALPRMLLAVCSCTARGTVTRVLQLAGLPAHVLADARAAAAGAGAAGTAPLASRKRRASDAAEAAPEQPAAAEAAGDEAGLGLALACAAAWCRRQASWEALRSQLMMLPVQHAEELPLGQPKRQLIRLPKAPVQAQLEGWAVAKLAAAAGEASPTGPGPKPAATMQLEEAGEAGSSVAVASGGAWRVDLTSAYFARLPELLRLQGVRLAAPVADAAHMAQHGAGLTLRYSLAAGHSVLTAITDLVRLGMLHLCLTRMAGCMAANPLAGAAKAARSNGGLVSAEAAAAAATVACDGPTYGGPANGQLPPEGAGSTPCALVWPLPGCGSVRLLEAGLTHLVLLVSSPPLPEGLQQLEQPAPLHLTVSWDNTLASSSSGGGGSSSSSGDGDGGSSGGAAAPAAGLQRAGSSAAGVPTAAAGAAGSTSGGSSGGGASVSGGGGSLRHIRCRVVSQPALPEPVLAALAQQLEAGRVDLFLDSLCLAGHAAAAAARQLTPEAQRAAGLLPGALRLAGPTAGAVTAGSSALRLRAQLQQGGRAVSLCLAFHAGGYTLLQLAPAQGGSAAAAASIWMPPLWDRLAKGVPTFAAVEAPPAAAQQLGEPPRPQQHAAQQLRQAWVHHSGLAEALAKVMRAVAATAAESR